MEAPYIRIKLAGSYTKLASVVLVATLLTSCFKQAVSVADLPKNLEPGGRGKLLVPGLGVVIRSSNETERSWLRTPPDFEISFWFAPTQPGFQFDPQQVRLVLDNHAFAPKHVFAISEASDPTRAHTWNCWSNRRLKIPGEPPYELKLGHCFEIYFDVKPPSSDASFSLHLGGLLLNGNRITVPEVRFKKDYFWVGGF